jgi:1-acyl-sn-glycerol-3-phosphate acyltransferase
LSPPLQNVLIELEPTTEIVEQRTEVALSASTPTRAELAVLAPMERFAFRVTHRMNGGAWKRLWTFCQRTVGMGWIRFATYNLMHVYGLEHVEATDHTRPLLLAANHRSFFDMYVVSAELFRQTRWRKKLFFPVRGRFFYESLLGMFVNLLMGWWSMYPPFFAGGEKPILEKREFDKFSMRRLVDLCRQGAGHVVGFHPEGTRNKGTDPYSYLRPQPGVGRVIKGAEPQVVPVFIAGLSNNLPGQIIGNWTGGEPVRIHFGPALDLSAFRTKPDRLRTHKEIADFVMAKIAELGEEDRRMFGEGR